MTIKLPQRRVTNAANNTCVRITEGASTGGVRLPLPVKRTGPRPSPLKLTVRCTACRHENAARLNLALIAGESARSVARRGLVSANRPLFAIFLTCREPLSRPRLQPRFRGRIC